METDEFGVSRELNTEITRTQLALEDVLQNGVLVAHRLGVLLEEAFQSCRQGSGFAVDTALVVTNYHVIEGAMKATAKLHDKTSADVEGFVFVDPAKDLALLRIDPRTGKPLRLIHVGFDQSECKSETEAA